jgi:hypothetical protein
MQPAAAAAGGARQKHDVFYLSGSSSKPKLAVDASSDADAIPIAKLDLASGLLDIPAPKGMRPPLPHPHPPHTTHT